MNNNTHGTTYTCHMLHTTTYTCIVQHTHVICCTLQHTHETQHTHNAPTLYCKPKALKLHSLKVRFFQPSFTHEKQHTHVAHNIHMLHTTYTCCTQHTHETTTYT